MAFVRDAQNPYGFIWVLYMMLRIPMNFQGV